MSKFNKKGFALVETLIVSVFVVTIFTMMYTNFFPMMGEYERREGYDDVDSIYKTYLIKKMLDSTQYKSDASVSISSMKNSITATTPYKKIFSASYNNGVNQNDLEINCKNLVGNNNSSSYQYCLSLFKEIKAENVYLTTYKITDLKQKIKNGSVDDIDSPTQDYINTLPYYKNPNNNCYGNKPCNYRIIVEYVNEVNKESEAKRTTYNFSTMGVVL